MPPFMSLQEAIEVIDGLHRQAALTAERLKRAQQEHEGNLRLIQEQSEKVAQDFERLFQHAPKETLWRLSNVFKTMAGRR